VSEQQQLPAAQPSGRSNKEAGDRGEPRWTISGSYRKVLQTAFVPASFGGFLQVDRDSCGSTEIPAGGSCRWSVVPAGGYQEAKIVEQKVIIKILYILFYLRCQ
jgi:hypothetical protein